MCCFRNYTGMLWMRAVWYILWDTIYQDNKLLWLCPLNISIKLVTLSAVGWSLHHTIIYSTNIYVSFIPVWGIRLYGIAVVLPQSLYTSENILYSHIHVYVNIVGFILNLLWTCTRWNRRSPQRCCFIINFTLLYPALAWPSLA